MITPRPHDSPAAVFLATISSVSPRYNRRSEWPTMTHWQRSLSIAGETSPVYAPDISQKQSWAPSFTPDSTSTSETARSQGNGGKIETSTRSAWPRATERMPRTRSSASSMLVGFIFQFAATSGIPGGREDIYASLRIATPGNSLPSRYSSVAPPPVETCEYRPASPSDSIAATVSPPPTSVYAPDVAMASPTALVPSLKSLISATPTGPFQITVPAPRIFWLNSETDRGPTSSAIQPGSTLSAS